MAGQESLVSFVKVTCIVQQSSAHEFGLAAARLSEDFRVGQLIGAKKSENQGITELPTIIYYKGGKRVPQLFAGAV